MSARSIKSLATFTAAAIVLCAAALAALALPASAAMATDVVLYSAAINSDSQGSNQIIGCQAGNHGVTEGSLGGVIAVANGCGVRVWLQGGSGWTYCVSPHQYTTLPGSDQFPTVVGVSTNTAACPSPGSMATKVVLFGTADNQDIGCFAGNHGVQEPNLFGVTAVANGCGVRVWLQGGSGWTFCVSPHQYTTLPDSDEFPTVVGVSTNRAAC